MAGRDDAWRARPDVWQETDWSLVASASEVRTPAEAERLWRDLVERYRHPIRLAARRKLGGHPDADDLADGFFAYLFQGGVLAKADPDRGRFRCFLQGVLRRYLAQQGRINRSRAVPLEGEVPFEETPEIESQEEADWAATVLRNAVHRLERSSPRGAELLLRVHGIEPYPQTSIEALRAEHGLSRNAIDVALHRARKRLRELVLEEIRATVATESDFTRESKVIVARLLDAWGHVFADPKG